MTYIKRPIAGGFWAVILTHPVQAKVLGTM